MASASSSDVRPLAMRGSLSTGYLGRMRRRVFHNNEPKHAAQISLSISNSRLQHPGLPFLRVRALGGTDLDRCGEHKALSVPQTAAAMGETIGPRAPEAGAKSRRRGHGAFA